MHFERAILDWILWTLLIALVLGGAPWKFPANGEYWSQKALRAHHTNRECEY